MTAKTKAKKLTTKQLIDGQMETLAYLGDRYAVIEAMAEGFTITTERGDYTITSTEEGLEPWLELARAHLNERVACVARIVATFKKAVDEA